MERESKNPTEVGSLGLLEHMLTRRQLLGLGSVPERLPVHEARPDAAWAKRLLGCMAAGLAMLGVGQHALTEADASACIDTDIACHLAEEGLSVPEVMRPGPIAPDAEAAATVAPTDTVPATVTTLPPSPETTTTVTTVPELIQPPAFEAAWAVAAFPRFEMRGRGVDISYPNCAAAIPPDVDFGIVGVNGGRPFMPNDCLAAEAANFPNLALYINTSYPGFEKALEFQSGAPLACAADDADCIAYNYGFQSGRYAVEYARGQGIISTSWWLDVETANSWQGSFEENIRSLQGHMDAVSQFASQDVGGAVDIGFYSVPSMWQKITGGWQNGYPSWVASGKTTAEEAAPSCTGKEFTGGRTVMVQYVDGLDNNLVC